MTLSVGISIHFSQGNIVFDGNEDDKRFSDKGIAREKVKDRQRERLQQLLGHIDDLDRKTFLLLRRTELFTILEVTQIHQILPRNRLPVRKTCALRPY